MKKLFITLLILPYIHYGQMKTQMEVFNNSRGKTFDVADSRFNSYSGIDGSPYLNENFQTIKIDGYQKKLPSVRYNAFEDEMEYISDNKLYYVEKIDNIRMVFPENKTYLLTHYYFEGKENFGYLVEVLHNDKYSLYKREIIQLVESNNNTTNTYLQKKNPNFERVKDVLMISRNNVFTRFPKNKKELLQYFKSESDLLSKFIKENNINLSNEIDIKKLINYVNSL